MFLNRQLGNDLDPITWIKEQQDLNENLHFLLDYKKKNNSKIVLLSKSVIKLLIHQEMCPLV